MASILAKDRAPLILNNANFASLTNMTAAACATNVDVRSIGATGNHAGDYRFFLEWVVRWSDVTGIAVYNTIAEVYAVPAMDGTNFVDVDTTAGASIIAPNFRVGGFQVSQLPTNGNDRRFATAVFRLFPTVYKIYIKNISGKTTTGNSTVTIQGAQDQTA